MLYYPSRQKAAQYPGVAKFGIALEWGSRGPEFESQHSDHEKALKSCDFKAFLSFGTAIR